MDPADRHDDAQGFNQLEVYEHGLALFNDDKQQFEKVLTFPEKAPVYPAGHTFRHGDHIYFANPFPRLRVRADAEALKKLSEYEILKPITTLRDDTGKAVAAHAGSISWNAYRRRWVMIAVQHGGKSSLLGEVWYAEAETLDGPWVNLRKIVTHDRYSFYNPRQHPYFAKDNGRVIYFEGTYTTTFSGNPLPTPRYNYNQIMYRLDVASLKLDAKP